MRIVTLLPSATEIVCRLELGDSLVGVTHECDYPPFVSELPKVTRTLIPGNVSSREIDQMVRDRLKSNRALYELDMTVLQKLAPDLIITQALCDVCAVAEEDVSAAVCALPGRPRVLNLEPMSLEQVFSTLQMIGEMTGVSQRANRIVGELRKRTNAVASRSRRIIRHPRVVLLEWIDPPFSSGHWSPELVEMAGGVEQLGRPGIPSRTLRWEDVLAVQPEVIVIACCGFDVQRSLVDVEILRQYPGWSELPAVLNHRVYVVDGSMYFNRPGPRLVESLELIAHAIHPDHHPVPLGIDPALQIA